MTRFDKRRGGPPSVRQLILFLCFAGILSSGQARAVDDPGLSLRIYEDPSRQAGAPYGMDSDPVRLTVVLRNEAGEGVYTEKPFSAVEIHRSLVLTDPGGGVHQVGEEAQVLDPPPPVMWNDRSVTSAEVLPSAWARSVQVDLKVLFPIMTTTPGWYNLEAHQPFVRFGRPVEDQRLGLLGLLDDLQNWTGTVNSNKLQIYIAAEGAKLETRVLDGALTPPGALPQVPVRVFTGIISSSEFSELWAKGKAVLSGTTGLNGVVVWDDGGPCLPKSDYTALAYYGGSFTGEPILSGDSGTWTADCGGSIQQEIVFTGALPPMEPISDLYARAKSGKVDLAWACPPDAVSYNIYRRISTQSDFTLLKEGHLSTYCAFADFGLTNNVTYCYVVRWVDSTGRESPDSNGACAKPTARAR